MKAGNETYLKSSDILCIGHQKSILGIQGVNWVLQYFSFLGQSLQGLAMF